MGIPAGSYDLIPLDGMRKTVARRMTDSFRDVPHFPLTLDIEIDELLAARTKINGLLEKSGVKVSVNDFVMKAWAAALMKVPAANATWAGDSILYHKHADVAVAVSVPGGLFTPVVKACETKSLRQISEEVKDLAGRVKGIHLADKSKVFNTARIEALEVENLMEAAQATMTSAAARKECRGAHTVKDYERGADDAEFPLGRNDKEWMKHTLWDSATNSLSYKPVNLQPRSVDSVPPKVRTF